MDGRAANQVLQLALAHLDLGRRRLRADRQDGLAKGDLDGLDGGDAAHALGVDDFRQAGLALRPQVLIPLEEQTGDLADLGSDEFFDVAMHHCGGCGTGQVLLKGRQDGGGGCPNCPVRGPPIVFP